MDFKIPASLSKQMEFTVEEQYLANFLGSGSVPVLSTPSMILFMETVSRIMMDEVLPDEFTTVGTKVCISHLSACAKGAKVTAKSSVKEQSGKKIVFTVEVWYNDTKLGEGTHERSIIDKKKFKERVLSNSK